MKYDIAAKIITEAENGCQVDTEIPGDNYIIDISVSVGEREVCFNGTITIIEVSQVLLDSLAPGTIESMYALVPDEIEELQESINQMIEERREFPLVTSVQKDDIDDDMVESILDDVRKDMEKEYKRIGVMVSDLVNARIMEVETEEEKDTDYQDNKSET